MDIKNILTVLLLLQISAVQPATANTDLLVPGSRPNIVVIMVDDLEEEGFDEALDAGLLPGIQTVFAQNGLRFSNSFVTNSLCCPSRVTFLTGQYAHNHGVLDNLPPYGFDAFDDASTLATWLHDGGYKTGMIGKYLNGYRSTRDLNDNGTIENNEKKYVPPGWDYWNILVDPLTFVMYDYVMLEKPLDSNNRVITKYPDKYQTDLLAEKAVGFIEAIESYDEAPFFLWVSSVAPHGESALRGTGTVKTCGTTMGPLTYIRPAMRHRGLADSLLKTKTAAFNESDISDKPLWLRQRAPNPMTEATVDCMENAYRRRIESLIAVDDLVKRVVGSLRNMGEEDTILMFLSDNGFMMGEHRLAKKLVVYEDAIRVPLFMRDLSVAHGAVIDDLVINNDMAPTLSDLAGVTPGLPVDGRSILPRLEISPTGPWRQRLLVEHFPHGGNSDPMAGYYTAIREHGNSNQSPFLYVEHKGSTDPLASWPGCTDDLCEFYKLAADPLQLFSLHREPGWANFLTGLSGVLGSMRDCAGDTCRALEDGALQDLLTTQ